MHSTSILDIDGNGDVRDAAVAQRGAAGEIGDIFDVRRAHDRVRCRRDTSMNSRSSSTSCCVCVSIRSWNCRPGDGQHRLAVELGVVQAVEQMNAARAGSRQADAELAGVLGIGAGHERRRFFVAHLDEADLRPGACAALP